MSGRRPKGPGPSRPRPPAAKRSAAAKRAPGPKGATGAKRATGAKGATDAKGATGAKRPRGAKRPTGKGAPERTGGDASRQSKGSGRDASTRRRQPERERYTVPANPSDEAPMRVQRALARAGVASRREADRLVAAGRVTVNGQPAVTGQLVDTARDVIKVDDERVSVAITSSTWIVLHKPTGVMTTRDDPGGRTTVFDLVDDVPGLVYVGRLDFLTEGLLLLTTDGQAAHRLTHPSREVERTYVAIVRGDAPTAARLAMRGVELDDGFVKPIDVHTEALGERRWAFEITLIDGRTREVRRLCDALDLSVERLVRTRYGPVRLEQLPVGASRALTARERTVIEALSGAG